MPTIDRIDAFADELTAIRRDFHAHPEIGFEEVRTSGIVAEKLIICAAPGAMPADTASLPWTRLRPGIRIKPNGPVFTPPSR